MQKPSRLNTDEGRAAETKLADPPNLRLAASDDVDVPSPALLLRQMVADTWPQGPSKVERRWSPRAMLFLSGGVSVLLWGALAWAAAAIL